MNVRRSKLSELAWLSQVREVKQPLSEQKPIWVRHGVVESGPTIPHPEVHPYCELSTILEGAAIAFVGRENVKRQAGDYFLAGTGVAHWYEGVDYPVKFAAIYFLPSVVVEMGPLGDGIRILCRFTTRQSLADRVVRPPRTLAPLFKAGFAQMIQEFDNKSFGHEVRLRSLLMEMLVRLIRWEQRKGKEFSAASSSASWTHVQAALQYLHEHFAEDIYARDLAAVASVSESRLKVMFQEVLGMPWSRYLQGYRVHRAAALLGQRTHTILEASLMVGFESLSHFHATFRSVMGMSPSVYAKRLAGQTLESATVA